MTPRYYLAENVVELYLKSQVFTHSLRGHSKSDDVVYRSSVRIQENKTGIWLWILTFTFTLLFFLFYPYLYQVIFTNEQTNEYQYFEVVFRSTRPGVIGNIDLVTPVRQSVPHTILLENPLLTPVIFTASCTVPEVLMPTQLSVPAESAVSTTTPRSAVDCVQRFLKWPWNWLQKQLLWFLKHFRIIVTI